MTPFFALIGYGSQPVAGYMKPRASNHAEGEATLATQVESLEIGRPDAARLEENRQQQRDKPPTAYNQHAIKHEAS